MACRSYEVCASGANCEDRSRYCRRFASLFMAKVLLPRQQGSRDKCSLAVTLIRVEACPSPTKTRSPLVHSFGSLWWTGMGRLGALVACLYLRRC